MTSGKSACYTRQKMLLPPRPRPPLYANERTNEQTNANGRQFLYVYLDATVKGREERVSAFVRSFLRFFALSTVFRASS